jgi:hypothetical protein
MGVQPEDKAAKGGAAPQEKGTRWTSVLEEVVAEQERGRPWWQNVGIFISWAAGCAVAAALAATVVLGFVELFQKGRQFSGLKLSDYIFWASAILMALGFLVPSGGERKQVTGKKTKESAAAQESRSTRMLRQRMRRMYDPWRWRLWAGAALAFGIAALVGLGAMS